MSALIEAIHIKRKTLFEFENAPYTCLDSDITTPTARGGQTLVRLKMRNLLNSAVFEKHSRQMTSSKNRTFSWSRHRTSTAMATALTSWIRRATKPSP